MTDDDPGPALDALLRYAVATELIGIDDQAWALNRLLDVLQLDAPGSQGSATPDGSPGPDQLLAPLIALGIRRGIIEDTPAQRDLLDAALMGALMPRPSEVITQFWRDYEASPRRATDRFYRLCVVANYIHAQRSASNPRWSHPSRYGDIDITINLAKPEKDPRDIIAAGSVRSSGYPLCLLCRENEGYAGRIDHPARGNLRLIGVQLAQDDWYLQYSPYLYYPEHCIVLDGVHEPMALTRRTFSRLLDFVAQFDEYFVGSNADLPIVGGSILSHDHFQGGRYEFPIERAATVARFTAPGRIRAEVLDWPLSVVRLTCDDPVVLGDAGFAMLEAWRGYDVPATGVVSRSGATGHNTVTPIARRAGTDFVLDIVLRNNRTSTQHPDGIFHPHAYIHPVKKENIGLIEVMGLAVLPGRLAGDIARLADAVAGGVLDDDLSAHAPMLSGIDVVPGDAVAAQAAVRAAIGDYFVTGLEHCGVLGPTVAAEPLWRQFLAPLGYVPS